MSGGYWNYSNDSLAHEIFGYWFDVGCGLDSAKHDSFLKAAVHENPMEDPEISALLYDVFCLLHSYDWAKSGDTDEDVYRKNAAAFKKRWFKPTRKQQIRAMIDICVENLKDDLYKTFAGSPANGSEL